ncbi:MAG: 3-mercaptopyruvate sulfurtransferase SseA/sterol desaturase [Cognaticolwellia sp.]|jgi:3-mercaptopyruvate sulfurtransferase SseA/sterol desaturase/sphingolipid hydroxylase (fatty acid hydroxylase superfamily)
MMNYLLWLLGISLLVAVLERLFQDRAQKVFRKWSWSDALHLVFNGHFLGLMLYGIAYNRVLPVLDGALAARGWTGILYRQATGEWPLILQIIIALFVVDFLQWCVHNLLHRSNFLWKIHQVHHSVKDQEMDWIVSFRFSWLEPVIYKAATYLPLAWFGFAPEALFFHAVFGTFIGHLNHANLSWDYGPLSYLFNSPRMHIHHHDYAAPARGQNFGIIFSCWDWIFGTAYLPDQPPEHIGFPGVEKVPQDFFGQLVWPLGLAIPQLQQHKLWCSALGIGVIVGLYSASQPPTVPTPMFGESAASSQPAYDPSQSSVVHASSPQVAQENMVRFGDDAQGQGWAQPQAAVSATELAGALGSPTLVILDVRTPERFAEGHIPSARLVERKDYSAGDIPGVSKNAAGLQELLRSLGVNPGDTVVLMGDGGPEPYRFWWTLSQVAGYETRVLDGGLEAWKVLGERLAMGEGVAVAPGQVVLSQGAGANLMWADLAVLLERYPGMQLADTRTLDEFTGKEHNKKAARHGRIPGAKHLMWTEVLYLDQGVPRLKGPEKVRETFQAAGLDLERPMVTYCQSGTRSSMLYYAALQTGADPTQIWNYDGSWAEYSRLEDLPAAVGAE